MLTERYRMRLHGALSCYDRIVIASTLPGIRYAAGMTSFLNSTMFSHSQKPLWSRRA
jgi:menaquinone-dependent protoporphyrinogen IX oxidase